MDSTNQNLFRQFMNDQIKEIKKYMKDSHRDDTNEAAADWIDTNSARYREQWYIDHYFTDMD